MFFLLSASHIKTEQQRLKPGSDHHGVINSWRDSVERHAVNTSAQVSHSLPSFTTCVPHIGDLGRFQGPIPVFQRTPTMLSHFPPELETRQSKTVLRATVTVWNM